MTIPNLIPAYEQFEATAQSILHIQNDSDYQEAIETLETVFELAGDQEGDPYGALIKFLGDAINAYEESQEKSLKDFIDNSRNLPIDIALLGVLIDQHGLTYSDLPEIGGKSMVSQVMNQRKDLSRAAIEALAARFGISPKDFFE